MSFVRPQVGNSPCETEVSNTERGRTTLASLHDFLDELDFTRWYQNAAGRVYNEDPWASYQRARAAATCAPGRLRWVVELFLCNHTISDIDLGHALSASVLKWLVSTGLIRRVGERGVRSNYCLLSCFGQYLLVDWPVTTPKGRLVALDTYLSTSSFDCAKAITERGLTSLRCLDLGSGSGLLSALMSGRSSSVTAIDIDPTALHLTRLNLWLNDRKAALVHGDLTTFISKDARFDFVVVNPPWRVVPPGVAYPNPTARVGHGPDGLDLVRRVVSLLPGLLSPWGEALIRFDIPMCQTAALEISGHSGLSIEAEFLGSVSIEEQAKTSADTCKHLNDEVADLEQVFEQHYRSLGISSLQQVRWVVRSRAVDQVAPVEQIAARTRD